jgi:uncharacterized Zn-binding protein involved in type VI secretion
MKKFLIAASAVVLAAGLAIAADKAKATNTTCPVKGKSVDGSKTVTVNGKTIAVCCNSCVKEVKANPEKYAK